MSAAGPTASGWVEQYRYPVGRRAWEFPQGSCAGDALGDAAALATSKLAEETGLTAGNPQREPPEHDMVHGAFSDSEIKPMVLAGDIVDGPSLAALALYMLRDAA